MSMASLFDPRTVLLAKHAQHVVLIHFPIALFLAGVTFGLLGTWRKRALLEEVAYYNLLAAAWSTLPALATGLMAWRFQLEGQKLRGLLLLHLILGVASSVTIGLVWWMHRRARLWRRPLPGYRVAVELIGVGLVTLTGHLGGLLSGVNGPG